MPSEKAPTESGRSLIISPVAADAAPALAAAAAPLVPPMCEPVATDSPPARLYSASRFRLILRKQNQAPTIPASTARTPSTTMSAIAHRGTESPPLLSPCKDVGPRVLATDDMTLLSVEAIASPEEDKADNEDKSDEGIG